MTDGTRHHWDHAGEPVLATVATLPADLVSPREARRLLREAVASFGHDEWLDAGELAISEIVTNALLHAHTRIDVELAVYADGMCVSVRDYCSNMPVAQHYDEQASTGRGLGLVAAVARACGIQQLGDEGKVVWFCIGSSAEASADDLLEAWSIDDDASEPPPDDGITVVLRSMPPTLWLAARQHHDALLRELTLYSAQHPIDVDFAVVDAARRAISEPLQRMLDEAHAAGRSRPALPEGHPSPLPWVPEDLDLEVHVRPESLGHFPVLQDALDVAERLAVTGELLVRPGLPEIIAVRDWAGEQVVAQAAGSPAAPWAGTAQDRFETESNGPDLPSSAAEVALARDADRGVVAADDANRIVAISRVLADALGWDPDDLVGRRVVTLIPPHLREAHVAGFSRHLSTGEAHVLGVALELPVLHADGHEVPCRFLIERSTSVPGRAIYLAWIEPIER
jgi:PAS domain S-box-containing protein